MSEGTVLVSPHSDDTVMQAFGMLQKKVVPKPLFLVIAFIRSNSMVINRGIFLRKQMLPKLLPRPNELFKALRKNRNHFTGSRVDLLARLLGLREIYKVSRIRLLEDISFSRRIGAKTKYFDLPDSKVRHGGAIVDPNWSLIPDEPLSIKLRSLLKKTIIETGVANVLSPWPYGNKQHVDHRLVCHAATQVTHDLNVNLCYVDDLPYTRRPLVETRNEFGQLYNPVMVELGAGDMRDKYEAMNIYGSQMVDEYFAAVKRGPPGSSMTGNSETLWIASNTAH